MSSKYNSKQFHATCINMAVHFSFILKNVLEYVSDCRWQIICLLRRKWKQNAETFFKALPHIYYTFFFHVWEIWDTEILEVVSINLVLQDEPSVFTNNAVIIISSGQHVVSWSPNTTLE